MSFSKAILLGGVQGRSGNSFRHESNEYIGGDHCRPLSETMEDRRLFPLSFFLTQMVQWKESTTK